MTARDIGNIPQDCHSKVRLLLDYWLSIHPPAGLPGRRHLDPMDIPLLLPNICLIDAPTPAADFSFRLMGSRVETFFGGNFTGKPFVSAYIKNQRSRAYVDMCGMLEDRRPRWRRGPAELVENREYVEIERVFLPLAEDGTKVSIILGLLLAKLGDGDFC
jgi:hypothetical protein